MAERATKKQRERLRTLVKAAAAGDLRSVGWRRVLIWSFRRIAPAAEGRGKSGVRAVMRGCAGPKGEDAPRAGSPASIPGGAWHANLAGGG